MTSVRKIPRAAAKRVVARYATVRFERIIQRIANGSSSVIAGPWHSEIGFEILYWIPMLRWIEATFGLSSERVIAVSRGGAEPWYQGVAGSYIDLLDHMTVDELRELRERHASRLRGQKQLRELGEDRPFMRKVVKRAADDDATVLHPAVMFGLFRWFWSGARPISLVTDRTMNAPVLPPGDEVPRLADLPERYVAAKLYFSDCLPDTQENRAFLGRLLEQIAAERKIVLLDTGPGMDEHRHFDSSASGIINAAGLMTMRDNLETQTRIIANADALVSTYGGFSYLGPHIGIPTTSYFSHPKFVPGHLEVMAHASAELARQGAGAPFQVLHTSEARAASPLAAEPEEAV